MSNLKDQYKSLAHIAIYTVDIDDSIAFYEKIGGAMHQRDSLATSDGEKKLALVQFGGSLLELIQSPTPVSMNEGNIPHFAIYVDDLDKTVELLREAGVNTFVTPEKNVLPNLFGGLQNWFFTGPSGEQIELLQML